MGTGSNTPMAEGQSKEATIAGHFGEFLQGRIGRDGPVALITLPCPAATVTASWQPGGGFGLDAPGLELSRETLQALFEAAGQRDLHGRLRITNTVIPGGGCGVSTATLLATLKALGADMSTRERARLTAQLEGATDPLMLTAPATHLWASRSAESLARLPAPPMFDVIGGFLGPPQFTNPKDTDFADIADLLEPWKEAATSENRTALGALSTTSALRNQALRGGADLAPLCNLAKTLGAAGIAIAHTGSARALLFAPGALPESASAELHSLGLRRILRFTSGIAA